MAAPLNPEHVPHITRAPDPDRAARDRLLLARIREGDTAALDQLFCAYRNDLGAFVVHIVRSREAAEEIVHDLFLRLWESRDLWEFEGVGCRFSIPISYPLSTISGEGQARSHSQYRRSHWASTREPRG